LTHLFDDDLKEATKSEKKRKKIIKIKHNSGYGWKVAGDDDDASSPVWNLFHCIKEILLRDARMKPSPV
jgi:hypothetical protein